MAGVRPAKPISIVRENVNRSRITGDIAVIEIFAHGTDVEIRTAIMDNIKGENHSISQALFSYGFIEFHSHAVIPEHIE
jgi:hypothetical protein